MLIESGIISVGSIRGVLSGKPYNRSVMCHKLVFEVMERLRFQAFLDALDDEQESIYIAILDLMDCFAEGTFVNCMQSPQTETIVGSYEEFIENSSKKSKTFAFWNMYIKAIGMCRTLCQWCRILTHLYTISSNKAVLFRSKYKTFTGLQAQKAS